MSDQHQIFLSYSKIDAARVREIERSLRRAGFKVWFDETALLPGQDWELEITRALRDSKVVLICVSQRSSKRRGFYQKEIRLALDLMEEIPRGDIFAIPVRLEDCEVPLDLSSIHWADAFTQKGMEKLIRSLSTTVGFKPDSMAIEVRQRLSRHFSENVPREDLDEKIERMERIQELRERLAGKEHEIVGLMEQGFSAIRADTGFVAFEDIQGYLRIIYSRGQYWHLPVDAGFTGSVFASGRPAINQPGHGGDVDVNIVVSEMVAPIFYKGNVAGAVLMDRVEGQFTGNDLSALKELAVEMAEILS